MARTSAAPVTMKTLADHVGVSIATISNAFSRPDQLSKDLRDQILSTAEELGYAGPSVAGRALRSGRSDVCGLLFNGELSQAFSDPYLVIFLSGLSESLEEFGASVLLLRAAPGPALQRAPIDALVASSTATDRDDFDVLRRRGVRIVNTGQAHAGDWVGINDQGAARLIARHLTRLGHQEIAVVTPGEQGRFGEWSYSPQRPLPGMPEATYEGQRLRGLWNEFGQKALRVVAAGGNTREAGRRAAAHALDVQHRPTAIVALSDVLAFGVIDAARTRGLEPGRDLSITGFDDVPEADFLGLTTIHQPIAEKGRLAGLLAMDPDYPDRQISMPVELVVRSSTGPATTPSRHKEAQ